MDYKEKYEKALEWMRSVYPSLTGAAKEDAEHYFPELAESEDERIRKSIIKLIQQGGYMSPEDKTKAFAWLEKQKEQKPVEIHIDNPNIQKVDPDIKITTSDSSASGDELLYVCNKSYNIGYRDGKREAEKPAEWSEVELEFRGEKVKVKRPFFRDDNGRGYSTTEQDEEVSWNALRAWCEKKGISLYDLYPKVEWSEEDEKMLARIIERGQSQIQMFDTGLLPEHIAWLNSLRPQSHWKPTEEMMEAFKGYIEDFQEKAEAAVGGWNNFDVMIRLYEQLKEL